MLMAVVVLASPYPRRRLRPWPPTRVQAGNGAGGCAGHCAARIPDQSAPAARCTMNSHTRHRRGRPSTCRQRGNGSRPVVVRNGPGRRERVRAAGTAANGFRCASWASRCQSPLAPWPGPPCPAASAENCPLCMFLLQLRFEIAHRIQASVGYLIGASAGPSVRWRTQRGRLAAAKPGRA